MSENIDSLSLRRVGARVQRHRAAGPPPRRRALARLCKANHRTVPPNPLKSLQVSPLLDKKEKVSTLKLRKAGKPFARGAHPLRKRVNR